MRVRTIMLRVLPALVVVLGLVGCSKDQNRTLLGPDAGSDLAARAGVTPTPDLDPENFENPVANPYFPLVPGTVYTYVMETDEGTETTVVEVTHQTKTILGVRTTVVRDRVYLDDELIEDTFDWYAPDEDGNVWYLGEDTKEYENGQLVTTFGSWEAGVDGARAGIIMLADPDVGDRYQQEEAPDVAEDVARVLSLEADVSVPYGDFENTLQTLDWSLLEPGTREIKYYARGVGLVLETSRKGDERMELVSVTTN